ncbi:MAG: hypothetical protein DME13_22655 [Candidatus Rokuibacteriota bacterium]|nr:MAG: hypothetical protein DME13_22655 [Candidatus Rokubacteria bacterium]
MRRGLRPAFSSTTTASVTEGSRWRVIVSTSIASSAGVSGASWRSSAESRPSRRFWTTLQPIS